MRNENNSAGKEKWLPWTYFAAFMLLTAGIGTIGYFYLQNQIIKSRQMAETELSSIAGLKARQISEWYAEHLNHARFFRDSREIASLLKKLEDDPSDTENSGNLVHFMDSVRNNFGHRLVLMFNSGGKLLLSSPSDENWVGPTAMESISKTLSTGEITVSDLYVSKEKPGFVNMDFFIPIRSVEEGKKKLQGILMMEIDPGEFLFPLIQSWPTPSRSAETLLVRRDGDEVIYLNELRHRKDTSLRLAFKIDSRKLLPAAMAVTGKEGIVEGMDYRDVPVLADLLKIPGTPWFMVSKVDKEEIFAPIRKQSHITMVLILILILATFLGVGFLWKQRDADLLRKSHDEMERRVIERTAELAVVNRELEAFSYSVSHDLKAPLRSVDGFARMLEEDYSSKLDEEGRRLLKVIRDSAKDMGQLISDLLEFSRMSRKDLHKTNIDMNELVKEVYAQLEHDLKGRTVSLDTGSLPEIYGDPAMIKELLVNLLSNSFKFTRPRKVATVKVEGRDDGDSFVFTIKDNGVGFDMSYKDKLFCVFQRLHSASEFEGTGIGLALVQRIIQRHGGRVWAESELGKGATFYFSLPRKF
ncbi:MAG TPA: hypothetical protein DET40_04595 [Lentisphaeria bacterium]|nr:MAG: hypothetical protein A2X45_21525 [Lentisphaerae bacterium GWF2_50_93]HCE42804.1 hypothetical protein [Lentisphaeria bacterium]